MPLAQHLPHPIAGHAQELAELCRKSNVIRLELFGSATTQNFNPSTSDLDFLVTFGPAESKFHQYFDLFYALEDLFKKKIDLLSPTQLKNPYLIAGINKQRITIYDA